MDNFINGLNSSPQAYVRRLVVESVRAKMAGRRLSDAGGQKTGEFRMGQFYKWAEQFTIDLCQAAGGGDSVRAEMAGRRLSDAGGRKTTAASASYFYYVLHTMYYSRCRDR